MLNRSQIYTMLKIRNRENTLLSGLPDELIQTISEFGQNPNSNFDKAIKHVARGELSEVKAILEEASSMEDKMELQTLLLSSGTATTRCGLLVKHKTLLECAIGEGDLGMVEMIKSYFPMFTNGEEEMERQMERYRPCIKAILSQKPNGLMYLFDIIRISSDQDVLGELAEGDRYDVSYQSTLRTALNRFRERRLDPSVRVITEPRMHCNYQNLIQAYDLLYTHWQLFSVAKRRLILRQLIGFIQLTELPAYERYLFARDQVSPEPTSEMALERSTSYKVAGINDQISFPDFDESLVTSHSGFGINSYTGIYGGPEEEHKLELDEESLHGKLRVMFLTCLTLTKSIKLTLLLSPQPPEPTLSMRRNVR